MDTCLDKQLCFVSFLPHILDSGAEGRNGYLDTAREMGVSVGVVCVGGRGLYLGVVYYFISNYNDIFIIILFRFFFR